MGAENLPTKGRSMEIVTQTAPPDKKGFYIMNDAEKLIATIKVVRIPQAYDLKAWEANVIYEDAKLDTFRMMGHAFEYGFLKGQRATKLPADVLHLLTQADERQLKLIAGFVRQLAKKGGVA